jgi:hypothetical protein
MLHRPLLLPCLVSLALVGVVGCDPEAAAEVEVEPERGPLGKADGAGSCAPGECGQQSSSGPCWCDDQCVDYGDCCADKAAICDAPPAASCMGLCGGGPVPGSSPACYCDAACAGHGDCCADYAEVCTAPPMPADAEAAWSFEPIVGVPNLDSDDGNGTDWLRPPYAADDDFTVFTIPASITGALPSGHTLRLGLTGATDSIRFWRGGIPVLGHGGGTSHDVQPSAGAAEFLVEFGALNVTGTLSIVHHDAQGGTVAAAQVPVRSSPMFLNHHLQPAERLWVVGVNAPGYSNAAFVQGFQNALGNRLTTIHGPSYQGDVWIQDEIEFTTTFGDQGQRLDVIIDSIRERGLAPYARQQLTGPGTITRMWGNPNLATTFDAFGNLEASPPVTVGGVHYPFGRIYYGRHGNVGLGATLAQALAQQAAQAPFEIDSTWLCVGHVDEIVTFVPDPSSDKGFKLVIADVPAAYELLDALPAGTSLPRYAADHGFDTIGGIASHVGLRFYNLDIQQDHLDPILQVFMTELGLTEADVIRAPSLFEPVGACGAAALIPGMVNLTVAQLHGEPTRLFIADPFLRATAGNQASDPLIAAFSSLMPAGLELHYLDDWDVYHLGYGEVHCGSNTRRTPIEPWWASAAHLLGGLSR